MTSPRQPIVSLQVASAKPSKRFRGCAWDMWMGWLREGTGQKNIAVSDVRTEREQSAHPGTLPRLSGLTPISARGLIFSPLLSSCFSSEFSSTKREGAYVPALPVSYGLSGSIGPTAWEVGPAVLSSPICVHLGPARDVVTQDTPEDLGLLPPPAGGH